MLTVPKLESFDIIVFDLDDTLYSERDYVASGFDAVSQKVSQLYNVDFSAAIEKNKHQSNVLKSALLEVGLPTYLLSQLIEIYRYHLPKITLLPGAKEILDTLKALNKPLYLITDGRSLTQRLKIEALGIAAYFQKIYISEEQGHEKPSPHSFKIIDKIENNKKIVYIGDNPKKDFVAPKSMSWETIGIKHSEIRVHPIISVQEPDMWLNRIENLLDHNTNKY